MCTRPRGGSSSLAAVPQPKARSRGPQCSLPGPHLTACLRRCRAGRSRSGPVGPPPPDPSEQPGRPARVPGRAAGRPGRGLASVCAPQPGSRGGGDWPGRVGGRALLSRASRLSSAGGASFPRPLRLAPLFSPGPLRPAAEPRRRLGSAWGCAPGSRRRRRAGRCSQSRAPWQCQVRAPARVGNPRGGSGGPRSLRCALAASRAGSVLPRSALSLPTHLSGFLFTLPPLCPFSLPLVLSLPISSAFFFFYLAPLSPFPLSFPLPLPCSPLLSSPPPAVLLPAPVSFLLSSSSRLSPWSPAALWLLFSGEQTACQVCTSAGGGGWEKEGRSYLTMGPFRRRERNGKGPLSSSFPAAPPYLDCSW